MGTPDPRQPRPPLHARVARLRAYVQTFGSLAEAAASLGVSPGTLRRNTDREWATEEALDVIEEAFRNEGHGT